MSTNAQPGTFQFTGDYTAAITAMVRAMTELSGTIKKQNIEEGLVEAAWRYGLNPWGLRVVAQFRDGGDGSIIVTVRGGFKDAFSTVAAPREKAEAVLARFADLVGHQKPAPVTGAAVPPRLGDGSSMHRGKVRITAALLALLFGGIGVHRFYLGSWGVGLLYLGLLFVPGAGLVLAFIETVRFFVMSETAFDDRYNLRHVGPFTL
ncbi:TM2 domain-containing protein [Insolitispirillum peregrinum]|uniref:TM2 domain-containing protein n=1 Tax=Insolitispirillum peregrinum TaxID=80876 RepID=UPI0036153D74